MFWQLNNFQSVIFHAEPSYRQQVIHADEINARLTELVDLEQGFWKGPWGIYRGAMSRSLFLLFTWLWDKNEEIRDGFKVMIFFLFFISFLEQDSKQGAASVEGLWKGATNRESLRTADLEKDICKKFKSKTVLGSICCHQVPSWCGLTAITSRK